MPDPDRTTPHDDRADDQVGLYEQIYGRRPPVDPHDDHADTDVGLYEQIYGRPLNPQQNGDSR